jgi:N-acetylglutamate synthase
MVARLEAAALWAWPPRETAAEQGWLLRAAGGHTRRANSVQALAFAPSAGLEPAIGRVEAWYARRGLPACFQLTDHAAPASLDAALDRHGYGHLPPVSVLVGETAGLEAPRDVELDLDTKPAPRVMNAVCDPLWGPATRRARAELFARIRRPHVFAVALEDGRAVAGGLGVADGELVGVFALRTADAARGRGYGRAVVARLASWGRGMGAGRLYLQVEDGNAPARAVARALGAELAYGYRYRELDPQAA